MPRDETHDNMRAAGACVGLMWGTLAVLGAIVYAAMIREPRAWTSTETIAISEGLLIIGASIGMLRGSFLAALVLSGVVVADTALLLVSSFQSVQSGGGSVHQLVGIFGVGGVVRLLAVGTIVLGLYGAYRDSR